MTEAAGPAAYGALTDLANGIAPIQQLLDEKEADSQNRFNELFFTSEDMNIVMDCSRQRIDLPTLQNLIQLANESNLQARIDGMFSGARINETEDRAVLHTALRATLGPHRDEDFVVDGVPQLPLVEEVLAKIDLFTTKVRADDGEIHRGATGQKLTNIISVGIGGSYLGAEFVANALQFDREGSAGCKGKTLRFLANVDPLGFLKATEGLDPAQTLVVIISKTFTTRETLMNANLCRQWLLDNLVADGISAEQVVAQHMIAVSANPARASAFGILEENVFGFWDWVGGRYSVSSAVGIVPLSLYFGYDVMQRFLQGANAMDNHFRNTEFRRNIPVLLGLIGVWNSTFLGYGTRALIPYCESLNRLPAHIQQLDMESNGKSVRVNGQRKAATEQFGEIDFGEPGTNAQHSFFQLIHQGRTIPVDFIGFQKTQQATVELSPALQQMIAENHDELMANFFAQADALAYGKTKGEVLTELGGSADDPKMDALAEAKSFEGDRPSTILLFEELTPETTGQILAMFEHRTAVQGWIWGINSFDQFGVELGKQMGKDVKEVLIGARQDGDPVLEDANKRIISNPPSLRGKTMQLVGKYRENNPRTYGPAVQFRKTEPVA